MRIRVSFAVLLTCFLAATRVEAQFNVPEPAPAENFRVEFGAMFWQPTPSVLIQTGALAQIGASEIDLVQEFFIEKTRFTEYRVVLKPGRKHKLRFSYLPIEYNEAAQLQRTITFGGQTFPVSVNATEHLKWQTWRFGYEYDLVAGDRGFLGFITELKYNKVSAELGAEGFDSELAEATATVPTIGGILRVYPHRNFSVTTEFTGFKMPGFIGNKLRDASSGEDFEAKVFDLDIYGTLNFGSHVGVQGGYRSLTADYLVGDDAGDLKMKGFYFGGLVRF